MRPKPAAPAEAPAAAMDAEAWFAARGWQPFGFQRKVWGPCKMPLSTELADMALELIHVAGQGGFTDPEMQAAAHRVRGPAGAQPVQPAADGGALSRTAQHREAAGPPAAHPRRCHAERVLDAPVPAGRRRLGTQSVA